MEFDFPSCCQTGSNSRGDVGWEESVTKTQLPAGCIGTGKQIKASQVWSSRATKTLSEKQKQKQSLTNSQIKEEKKQWPINPALGFSATQQ